MPKGDLLRLVTLEGELVTDPAARRPGRGAYLCHRPECLDTAIRRRAFGRALRAEMKIPDQTLDLVNEWQRSAYTR